MSCTTGESDLEPLADSEGIRVRHFAIVGKDKFHRLTLTLLSQLTRWRRGRGRHREEEEEGTRRRRGGGAAEVEWSATERLTKTGRGDGRWRREREKENWSCITKARFIFS